MWWWGGGGGGGCLTPFNGLSTIFGVFIFFPIQFFNDSDPLCDVIM